MDWSQSQVLGHSFDSVEDFWCMMNNVKNPFETLEKGGDYSVFRKGLSPDWEDDKFKDGGRFQISVGGVQSRNAQKYFDIWIHLLLALIGENFDNVGGGFIAGLRLVAKKNNVRWEIWTSSIDVPLMEKQGEAILNLVQPIISDDIKITVDFKAFATSGPKFSIAEKSAAN